ncbi:hypothetical protein QFZ23_001072 [Arthrobacter globiformis]|nr:hypothetical protein [Arthrobacter globiformis]
MTADFDSADTPVASGPMGPDATGLCLTNPVTARGAGTADGAGRDTSPDDAVEHRRFGVTSD